MKNYQTINFGDDPVAFIKENIGPKKIPLVIEEAFLRSEFKMTCREVATLLDTPNNIIVDNSRCNFYLIVADTQEKIDQYLNSEVEGEYQATFITQAQEA